MRNRRTMQIRIALAALGLSTLLATALSAQQNTISLSGEVVGGNTAMLVSQNSTTPSAAKMLRVSENQSFKLRFSAPSLGYLACQEFPANGTHALAEGGGWAANRATEITVAPGNRLYPRQGEEKYLVIRCVAADKKTIVSDSIKIVRQ